MIRACAVMGKRYARSTPHPMRDIGDQPELLLLGRLLDRISREYRGETALRGERHLFARKVARGFVYPCDQRVGRLECVILGRDKPEHHALVLREVVERLEGSGARTIVFEQKMS